MRLGSDMQRLMTAAEGGSAEAQFNLAVMLGNRITKDLEELARIKAEAAVWLQRAAHQGLARAQLRLAESLADEAAAPAQRVKACAWFLLAMASPVGVHRGAAQSGYERISGGLSPLQIGRAQRLARLLKKASAPKLAAATSHETADLKNGP